MTISSVPRAGFRPAATTSATTATNTQLRVPVRAAAPPPDALALATGLCLVERGDGSLQLGTEAPLRILVRSPPPATADVLRLIDRGVPRSMATRRIALRLGLRASTWNDLLDELVDGGFLVDATGAAGVPARRGRSRATGLPAGPQLAGGGALADAVVVVVGTGRVASSLASLLVAAGTGHVHLDPDRAIRPGDAAPAGLAVDLALDTSTAALFDRSSARPSPCDRGQSGYRRAPGPRDHDALAATLRRSRPGVDVHRPAGYVRPGLVVVATDTPPDPILLRRFVSDGQPHLAVHVGQRRGVVGPLVLPGRSSCLQCHDLHRRDRDAGWPRVQLALQADASIPPVVLATSVAALGAEQALQFLTGVGRPAAVDGTIESVAGEWTIRRRSWHAHPGCSCHSEAPATRPSAGQEQ